MSNKNITLQVDKIKKSIFKLRGEPVILDKDIAIFFEVKTGTLNQTVTRNIDLFPEDFMFKITKEEYKSLKSHFVISKGRGGDRKLSRVFTETGVAMLSGVLKNSKKARIMIVQIVRAFVELRRAVKTNIEIKELKKQVNNIEKRQNTESKALWNAIDSNRKVIGNIVIE